MRKYKEIEKVEKSVITIESTCDKCGKHSLSSDLSSVMDWELNVKNDKTTEECDYELSNAIWTEDGNGNIYEVIFCPDCFQEILGKWLKKVER